MTHFQLATITDLHHATFETLAASWLQAGARSLYLTDDTGQLLVHWPRFSEVVAADITVPILLNGQLIGNLHLCGVLDPASRQRLTFDAQMISGFAQLEFELEKMTTDIIDQQDQLMALHQMAQTTRVYSDIRQNLVDLAQTTAQLLKTENAFAALQTQAQDLLVAAHPEEAVENSEWVPLLQQLLSDPSRQQWLLQKNDSPLTELKVPIRNLLVKKIGIRPGIALVLGAANKQQTDFQAPDVKLFSTIAQPAGANLENAILHQEMLAQARIQTEMELAKQVQIHLLPQHTPELPGIALAAQSRPASHVGGDFYDFVVSVNHLLSLTFGDVSGKGMPAALLMAMLRTVLRGKSKEMTAAEPAWLLSVTNESLYNDFSDLNMFATVFVAQYDPHHHLLHYANDGHAPVIFRPVHGHARLLAADAPPLGMLPINLAESYQLALEPGDLLVVASDGFSEAERSGGEMFGYDRLLHFVDQHAACGPSELLQRLFEAVDSFSSGYLQADDQTALILKRME